MEDKNFIEAIYEGIKLTDGKEEIIQHTYRFYQARYGQVLELDYKFMNKPDAEVWKEKQLTLKKICIKHDDGTALTDQEILDLTDDEGTWLDVQMTKYRCIAVPFGNSLASALEAILEAKRTSSRISIPASGS